MLTVILGLGNTSLRDDGVGIYTARLLERRIDDLADVKEAELAGFDLLEALDGYERAIIIDSIQLEGEMPGTVFKLKPQDLKITPRLASFHDIDIVTALSLGERLGLEMPGDVDIYAVQAEDVLTLEEGCLPSVEKAIPGLVDEIAGEVSGTPYTKISKRLDETSAGNTSPSFFVNSTSKFT